MSDNPKIQATHLARQACVYVRQSTETQVQVNRESTLRQNTTWPAGPMTWAGPRAASRSSTRIWHTAVRAWWSATALTK